VKLTIGNFYEKLKFFLDREAQSNALYIKKFVLKSRW